MWGPVPAFNQSIITITAVLGTKFDEAKVRVTLPEPQGPVLLALRHVDGVALVQAGYSVHRARDLGPAERPGAGVVARGAGGEQPGLPGRLARPNEVAVRCVG